MIRRWNGATWVDGTDEPVAAMDSFRLLDGGVVRYDLHEQRFAAAAGRLGVDLGDFLPAARAALPLDGDWFPRLELTAAGSLQLRLRPCPPIGTQVTLWPTSGVAQRDPHTKGADLTALAAAREAAVRHGADDALLLDASGRVLEGSTTALLWWRGDEPCVVATDAVLDSVTRRAVEGLAGTATRIDARLADLAGHEIWALNALHGVRPVVGVLGGPVTGAAKRAPLARAAYEALRTRATISPSG